MKRIVIAVLLIAGTAAPALAWNECGWNQHCCVTQCDNSGRCVTNCY